MWAIMVGGVTNMKKFPSFFSFLKWSLQEADSNDVLYVWTHLNLRGDQTEDVAQHNMTYSLGKTLRPSQDHLSLILLMFAFLVLLFVPSVL